MHHRPRGLSSVVRQVWVLAALLWAATSAHAQQPRQRYLIEFREYGPGAAALVRAVGGTPVHEFPTYRTIAASLPESALAALTNAPGILRIEPDAERYPLAQTTPYGIKMVQADQIPIVSGASHPMVCVIDSGYSWGHPDLPGPTGTRPPTGDSDIGGAGNWTTDNCGHGTHVAGTIAALGNTVGVVGVIPDGNLPLHIVKVFGDSCSWAYSSDLVAALNKCTAAGAKIVSMSLGGAAPTALEESAFDDAYLDGVLPIAAAGNGGGTSLYYPAGYSSVMSVGAVAQDRAVAGFSQKNSDVELVAPGVGVLSTVPWTNENSVTVDGATYYGNWIENAARNSGVTSQLVYGHLCDSVEVIAWSGKVVLCERGTITFLQKVTNVQSAGGVAAVVYNNVSGNFFGSLGSGASSTIPAISLSREDGLLVLGRIGQEGTVVSWVDPDTDGYEAWDGTSMATPHVSAVAAVLWTQHTDWPNGAIRRTLQATAADLGQVGIDTSYGFGLVQALAASGVSSPPPAVSPTGLQGVGSKVKSKRQAGLSWSSGSDRVSVFRNGVRIAIAVANTGTFTDSPPSKGNSFVYKVCEAHGATSGAAATCSNDVTIRF